MRIARTCLLVLILAMSGGGARAAAPPAGPAVEACRWEALARRRSTSLLGIVRWDRGTLSVRDDKVIWVDDRDPGRNLVVPISRVTDVSLTCPAGPAPGGCVEWASRTTRTA